MDETKVTIVIIGAVLAFVALILGYVFIVDHWEDIKALALIALVVGGAFSIAYGGFKLKSGR